MTTETERTGFLDPYINIINEVLEGEPQNFGTELSNDREVIAEHGQRVTETGSPNERSVAAGFAPAPGQTYQGGRGCPLRNPRGVEPAPGC